jgi:hypothetical protein
MAGLSAAGLAGNRGSSHPVNSSGMKDKTGSWENPIMYRSSDDIRYQRQGWFRRLRFSSVAMMMLAVGIGASTTIVAVMHAVLMNSHSVARAYERVPLDDVAQAETSIDYPHVGRWGVFSFPANQYGSDHNQNLHVSCAARSGRTRLSRTRASAESRTLAARAERRAKQPALTTRYQARKGSAYGPPNKKHPPCAS